MFKALVCDVCSGNLIMDESGEFATCEYCGMKHYKQRMQQKKKEISGAVGAGNTAGAESLLKRGQLFLEDSDWQQASDYFNRVLDLDPEFAPAYLGKLCAELGSKDEADLINFGPLANMANYQKALRFADPDYRVKLDGYNQAAQEHIQEQKRIREHYARYDGCISAGYTHTVGLQTDGRVVAVGSKKNGQCDTNYWHDIVALSAGYNHTVGLKATGTVVAIGDNEYGQCDTNGWLDVVAVAAGYMHTVGLKADGTVVAVGFNKDGQCDTAGWRDIGSAAKKQR